MFKSVIISSLALLSILSVTAHAESPADLKDLEIAHVAYTIEH